MDAARGLVRLSHHVPGWEEIPLAEQLQAEFGAPAAVDNDANVAALGEWRFGAGQGCESLLYVTISTGIGGGWVLGGRIWGGADGMAGEIGHMVVRPGGTLCACGRRGCWRRRRAAGRSRRRQRDRLLDEGNERRRRRRTELLTLAARRREAVTAQLVAQAAEAGDALARPSWTTPPACWASVWALRSTC